MRISVPWFEEACSTAVWTGTPLSAVLEQAGIKEDTVEIVFTGADYGIQDGVSHHYARSLKMAEAFRPEVLLVYAMNGRDLEPQHGYPLRLVVPGWYGMASVKWLKTIEAVTKPFDGFQQVVAYMFQRDSDDAGIPVSRMRCRALMIPPGIPDALTRKRFVAAGPVQLQGRAWSGVGKVKRVEVGADGEWFSARLNDPIGDFAWRGWTYEWIAKPGEHILRCRATDDTGATQPLDVAWNVQGMGNNVAQTILVYVS
jgi:sulfane dehydrogenase subunit SoxC